MRHNRYADQAAVGVSFFCFHSLLSVHLLNFLARSCKILQIREFLGKNLAKILTKKFRNIQDSYQELQEFLHWVVVKILLIFSMSVFSIFYSYRKLECVHGCNIENFPAGSTRDNTEGSLTIEFWEQ